MKRCLSLVLALIISVSVVLYCSSAVYSTAVEEYLIEGFVETGIDLIRENDADKEFEPEEIECETGDEDDSSLQIINDNFSEEELPDIAFQTCRLIVRATKVPDKLNSIGVASGFKNWYIVQFENEEDAKEAYNIYLQDKSVLSVSPDRVISLSVNMEDDAGLCTDEYDYNSQRLNYLGSEMTGMYEVKDYITSHPEYNREITIGVVDTGVDLDNVFVKDRLIRTYFNSSASGDEDSEYQRGAHGTMVSSVIVDNTPENVKIKVYKAGDALPISAFVIAVIKAADDNVDLINCSWVVWVDTELLQEAFDYCHEKDIPVIGAAGNECSHIARSRDLPAFDEKSITIASLGLNGNPSDFTSYGQCVDLMAPSDDIPVCYMTDSVLISSGTSFSSPMVASLWAVMMIVHPDYSNKTIEHMLKMNADPSDIFYDCGLFGYGVIDGIGSMGLARNGAPEFNYPEGKYEGEIEVTISAEEGCDIYYTLDGSYPSKENGIKYSEPINLSDNCLFLKAVAYGNGLYQSECSKSLYRLQRMGTDEMFDITEDGQITAYSGNVTDLIIPETIKGITVSSIAPNVFEESELEGVTFPDSMNTVSEYSFENCDTLMFADGKGITSIENFAFDHCDLYLIDFPNIETIGTCAFRSNSSLGGVDFPKCTSIGESTFTYCSSLRKLNMPALKSEGGVSFRRCYMLTEVNLPLLADMGNSFNEIEYIPILDLPSVNTIQYHCFPIDSSEFPDHTEIERLELSNVETLKCIPYGLYYTFGLPITMVLPSTLSLVKLFSPTSFKKHNPLIYVYGTRGTYAEQWTDEYENVHFIEISQETAVINDLPDEYYDYMRYLFADVVGFNRTYQWYGSYTDSNSGGIPIEGATERKFVPKDFQQYPYYYCKVVSTDVGYDPIEIKTGATKYMDYSGEIPSADYSRLDEVLATIPDNLSVYTDESVAVLNGTLNEIDKNLDASSQDLINEYINNVSEAIASLRLKKYKITFVVDENTKYEYLLEYGEKISLPEDPQKEGYIFKGWTEGVSDTIPACDLTVFAIFEKQGNPSVEIKNYVETRTVCYKTTIIFTAETNDLPDDAAVVWYENGELVESGNRVAKLRATKDFTIQAKVIDNDGNVIAESDVENVKVKHTFIAKLIAFFKMLFGRLPVIEQ